MRSKGNDTYRRSIKIFNLEGVCVCFLSCYDLMLNHVLAVSDFNILYGENIYVICFFCRTNGSLQ